MSESNELVPVPPATPVIVTSVPRRFGDRRRFGRGTPVDLGALVALVPQISEMLSTGDGLVRIVGSRELLDGIRHNTVHYMRGELGHTTAVLDQHGRIVGHVQLQPAKSVSAVPPAAAVFQIGSAITLQYYLQRFDEQLTEIMASVRMARQHAAWTQIARAALETSEIAEALQRDGLLAPTCLLGSMRRSEPSMSSCYRNSSRSRKPFGISKPFATRSTHCLPVIRNVRPSQDPRRSCERRSPEVYARDSCKSSTGSRTRWRTGISRPVLHRSTRPYARCGPSTINSRVVLAALPTEAFCLNGRLHR